MAQLENHFKEIDTNRSRRARELSAMKSQLAQSDDQSPYRIKSKAVIVLAYAHWEGFYNECISTYLTFLSSSGKTIKDANWSMLAGVLSSQLKSLRDRNHSAEATCDFIDALGYALNARFDAFDAEVVRSRSNLNFKKLESNYRILNFDLCRFQEKRIRLDKELVGWRNGIAHGDDPDLSSSDSRDHIEFTQQMLLILADQFQEEIAKRAEGE